MFVFTIKATAFFRTIRQQHKFDDFKFSHFDVCYDAVLFTAKTSQRYSPVCWPDFNLLKSLS